MVRCRANDRYEGATPYYERQSALMQTDPSLPLKVNSPGTIRFLLAVESRQLVIAGLMCPSLILKNPLPVQGGIVVFVISVETALKSTRAFIRCFGIFGAGLTKEKFKGDNP